MDNLRCQRHLMILGLLGFAVLYILRVNLSVAIVAMVGTEQKKKDDIIFKESCPANEKDGSKETVFEGEINWDEKACGEALASFFYGYILTNFAGGRLADRLGGKRVFGFGVFLTSVLAFLLPAAARNSKEWFNIIRLFQGMTEGVTFPSINSLMSSWVQPSRRSLFMSRIAGGSLLGTVIIFPMGGWLAQTTFGWPSIFYTSGAIGLLWCVAWYHTVADHPNDHPYVTEEEKLLILKEIGNDKSRDEAKSVPWGSIFTSLPFLATIVAHFGSNFGFYFLLTELPTYLSTVHHFNMRNNGLISSLPYLFMWLFSVSYGSFIHYLTTNKIMPIYIARTMSNAIGMYVPMALLICISYAGCSSGVAVSIICFAVSMSAATQCGYLCSFQELAPNYAGTLTGISNTVASIPGFLAPIITSAIIEGQPTIEQWNKIFMVASFIYFVTGTFNLLFMSSEVQPWNSYTRLGTNAGRIVKNI
ncbi:UNVERIFIED_CONTAM: hypothetical protein RMT77_012501 [Armadillidium vulgare]